MARFADIIEELSAIAGEGLEEASANDKAITALNRLNKARKVAQAFADGMRPSMRQYNKLAQALYQVSKMRNLSPGIRDRVASALEGITSLRPLYDTLKDLASLDFGMEIDAEIEGLQPLSMETVD